MSKLPKSTGPGPNDTIFPFGLVTQTGMPPIVQSRSNEQIYDSLMYLPKFILNPYGPQQLNLSRSQYHW
jgi:hypothetical protein